MQSNADEASQTSSNFEFELEGEPIEKAERYANGVAEYFRI
jgi:hypothetical protein